MKTVAFLTNQLSFRGTETTVWGYAHYNETILGNKSIIIVNSDKDTPNNPDATPESEKYFTDRFSVYKLLQKTINQKLIELNVNICIVTCGGYPSDFVPDTVPTILRCVFTTKYKRGTLHTCVSPFLSRGKYKCKILPDILYLGSTEETLHTQLNIHRTAKVFGRHGGLKQFDIPWAQEAVVTVAKANDDIYFIFLNTQIFCSLKNVLFLPATRDLLFKRKFINTCDAMIHAGSLGETFGMSCGEFAICNKPIITTNSGNLAHVDILGDKVFIATNKTEMINLLMEIDFGDINMINNGYHKYTPEPVMKILNECINSVLKNN